MDGDTKVWTTLWLLLLLVGFSYYGVYRVGKHTQFKVMESAMIELATQTYYDGYRDGVRDERTFAGHPLIERE